MIFTVANTKGGVGKTTVAVHLAAFLAGQGPTLLIDGDPQASAASWAAWRRETPTLLPSPTTVRLAGKAILEEGRRLAAGFDHVVVDAGGRDSAALRAALLLAERVIVPVGASSLDSAALTDLLEVVELARDFNPELDLRVLLNRVDPRSRDTGDMLGFLAEQGLRVLDARLCERVAYRRTVGDGSTVAETRKDRAAACEMDAMLREVAP